MTDPRVDEAQARVSELEAENKRLRKSNRALARAALGAERGCPSCAHCQLKRGGHLA